MSNIHPTAIIDKEAKIGKNVTVGPYAVIGKNTVIGDDNYIGPHCVIENTTMGNGNEFIASSFIGVKPQDLSYNGVDSRVVMGNNNKIRECVTIHRSSSVEQPTKLGDGCLLMANAHVAHDCILGNRIIMVNCAGAAGHVEIADNAILSGMVGVHQFTRIGRLAMVSGLSGVPLDVPPFCRASGGRAKLVGLNTVGLRRAGIKLPAIREIKEAYKTLFLSTHTLKEALEIIKAKNPGPEVMELVTFCETSKRGITRARQKNTGAEADDEE